VVPDSVPEAENFSQQLVVRLGIKSQSNSQAETVTNTNIGETKRFLRTNSRIESFLNFEAKHKLNLLKRGYSTKYINKHTDNIWFIDRSSELKQKNRPRGFKRLSFVTRFTPAAG